MGAEAAKYVYENIPTLSGTPELPSSISELRSTYQGITLAIGLKYPRPTNFLKQNYSR